LEEPFSADFLGPRREPSTLLIRKPQSPSTQLLLQGSIFLLETFDHAR